MRAFLALLRREVFGLAISPFVWFLLGLWYLLNALFLLQDLARPAVQNDLDLLPMMTFGSSGILVWLLLPATPPLLTLRLLAEEQRLGTLESLLTAPIGDLAIVLAKYLAVCLYFLVFWSGVLGMFLLLAAEGAPLDPARVLGGFTGALGLSFLFLASGLWTSSWGGNLLFAAGAGAGLNYALLVLPVLFRNEEGLLGDAARAMDLPHMLDSSFASGIVDTYALLYLASLSALFLFLTWIRLVSRRWVP